MIDGLTIKEKKQISQEDMQIFKIYFFNELEKIGTQGRSVHQKHDKSFKFILANQDEMSKFLSQFLGFKVELEKLEEQKNTFVNDKFQKSESDVIYKIKDTEIYFLIEHQSSVDKNMPERILKYSLEIRDSVQKNRKEKVKSLVVPIVVYTGARKWSIGKNFSCMQADEKQYKEYAIKQKYKLIDINQYTKNELINKNTKMSSMLLIEKCKDKEEILETLIKLIELAQTKERIRWLEKIITYVYFDNLGEDAGRILEILREREERMNMDIDECDNEYEDIYEEMYCNEWGARAKINEARKEANLIKKGIEKGTRNGIKEGRKKGKKEGILEIIKNMLSIMYP